MSDDATEQDVTKRLTKAFTEALAAPRSDPWVVIDPEHLSEAIDHMEWIEKGLEEWQQMYVAESHRLKAANALGRIAIRHLKAVLTESQRQDAQDWLLSVGE